MTAINTKTNTVVGKPPRLLRPNTANNQTNTVSVINTAANAVITAVPVGTGPHMVAVTPDGSRVYVPNLGVDTVSVIDPATNTVISTIGLGGSDTNLGVAVRPDGRKVYATSAFSYNATVISAGP